MQPVLSWLKDKLFSASKCFTARKDNRACPESSLYRGVTIALPAPVFSGRYLFELLNN